MSEKKQPSPKKSFLPIGQMMGLASIKQIAFWIGTMMVPFRGKKKEVLSETFEEAMQRLQLTEEDLVKRRQALWIQSMVILGLGLLMIAYCFFSLYQATFVSAWLSFLFSVLLFAYAFRAHFWYYQLSKRKLGCTFSEWFNQPLR